MNTTTSKTTKHVQQFLKTKKSTFSSTPKTLEKLYLWPLQSKWSKHKWIEQEEEEEKLNKYNKKLTTPTTTSVNLQQQKSQKKNKKDEQKNYKLKLL